MEGFMVEACDRKRGLFPARPSFLGARSPGDDRAGAGQEIPEWFKVTSRRG